VDINREMICTERIAFEKGIANKAQALSYLAQLAETTGVVKDKEQILRDLTERESEFSTGFGDRFAIPHAKSDAVAFPALFVVRLDQAVEWEAIDDQPVEMLIGIMVPKESAGNLHIQILSTLSGNLIEESFKSALMNAETKTEIYTIMQNALENEEETK